MTNRKHCSCNALQTEDLSALVLEPLANQIDRCRLEILGKLENVEELIDIVARQTARLSKNG